MYTHFNYQNLFIYLFLYLVKSYRSLKALILPVIFMYYLFCYFLYIVVFVQNV